MHGDDGVYFDAHPMLEGIEIVMAVLMATQHIMHKQHQCICLHLQILETDSNLRGSSSGATSNSIMKLVILWYSLSFLNLVFFWLCI